MIDVCGVGGCCGNYEKMYVGMEGKYVLDIFF